MQAVQDALDQIQGSLSSRKRAGIPHNDLLPFRGRSDENFDLWLDRFNRHAQAAYWTDEDKRKILPALLRDAAEVIFQGIPIADRPTMTFDELVVTLRSRFDPAHAAEIRSAQLHHRRQQPGESVLYFSIGIQRLTIEGYGDMPQDARKQLMRRFFIGGLRPEIWRLVIASNHQTFADAERHAKAVEAQLNMMQQQSYQAAVVPAPSSQNFRTPNYRKHFRQKTNFGIKQNRSSYDRTVDGRPICFNCGLPGHISVRCRKPQTRFLHQSSNPSSKRQNFRPQQREHYSENRYNQRPNFTINRPPATVNTVDSRPDTTVIQLQLENNKLRDQIRSLSSLMNTQLNLSDHQHRQPMQTTNGDVVYSCQSKSSKIHIPHTNPTHVAKNMNFGTQLFNNVLMSNNLTAIVINVLLLLTFFFVTHGLKFQHCPLPHSGLHYGVPEHIKCVPPTPATVITEQ